MRHIDADKFAEDICKLSAIDEHSANAVIFLLHEQPTVDIKTEVAKEIFAEIETILQRYMNEHDYGIGDMLSDVNELENKYMKEQRKKGEEND